MLCVRGVGVTLELVASGSTGTAGEHCPDKGSWRGGWGALLLHMCVAVAGLTVLLLGDAGA